MPKNLEPIRRKIKELPTITRSTQKQAKKIDKINNQIQKKDYHSALRGLKSLIELGNTNERVFYLAIECAKYLRNYDVAKRIFYLAESKNIDMNNILGNYIGILKNLKKYDEIKIILKKYSHIKPNLNLIFELLDFFLEINDTTSFSITYNMAKTKNLNKREMELLELKKILFLIKFKPKLAIEEIIKKIKNYEFDNFSLYKSLRYFYDKEMYSTIIEIYESIPLDYPVKLNVSWVYFEALRKNKNYSKVFKNIDEFIKLAKEIGDKKLEVKGELIKAYCLDNANQRNSARKIFERLVSELNNSTPEYLRALTGYIFTIPNLSITEINKHIKFLKNKLNVSQNKQSTKDIKDAINILMELKKQ